MRGGLGRGWCVWPWEGLVRGALGGRGGGDGRLGSGGRNARIRVGLTSWGWLGGSGGHGS